MKLFGIGRIRSRLAAALQPSPMVLKPYTNRMPLRWRVAGGISVVLLTLLSLIYGFGYALTTPFMLKEFLAPLVPLACVAIWALPESKAEPSRALEVLFWAFFLATILWPNYLAVALPGLPWISAVRLIGLPMATVLLIRLSTSKDFNDQIRGSVSTIPAMGRFMAGFVAIQIFSVAISDHPISSADVVFDNQIGWTATFFIACYMFRRPGTAQLWVAAYCICAVLLCPLGIWESKLEHVPWADHVPKIFAVQDESVQRALAGARRLGIGDYRVEGPQSTSLGFAEFLALSIPFLLHYIGGPYRTIVRLLAIGAIVLIFYVILISHARLGVVGFFLATLLYLLIWSLRRWRRFKGGLLGPAIVAAYPTIFLAVIVASFFVGRIRNVVWGNSETAASNQGRIEQLKAGIPMLLTHPWGYGTGRGAEKLGWTDPGGVLTIDNYFLLVALDWGILGFIFYYGMIVMVIWYSARYGWLRTNERHPEHTLLFPAGVAMSVFIVIKTIFSQTHNHKLQFMIMGMICALIYRVRFGVPGDDAPAKEA